MSDMTPQEQLMLELINRARMDPNGEAKRFGIKLNEGVDKGQRISADSKQVLAGNDALLAAANKHSDWMLATDIFSHTETVKNKFFTGKDPGDRMKDAGYDTSSGFVGGENIAFTGSTTKIDKTAAVLAQYRDLFIDKGVEDRGHRVNILGEDFREVGIGQEVGKYNSGGTNFNASMITQDFGKSGTDVFVTGVIYNDTRKNDNFFTVGEQVTGRAVSALGASDQTGAGGGYELSFSAGGSTTITFNLAGGNVTVDLSVGSENLKIDIVNGREVWTNASIDGVSANVKQIHALGIDGIDLTGSASGETYYGNSGRNSFTGAGGDDTFVFHRGDTGKSGASADVITDFSAGDVIDLHLWDANIGKNGNQDFKFVDTADFHGKAGELRYFQTGGDTLVQGDTNGDGKADFVIRLTGTITLTDANFDL